MWSLRVGVPALILLPFFATAQTLKPEEIYQKVLPSVMTLHVENARGENYIGTAFLALDTNIAVTAWHVVSDAIRVTAKFSDDRVVNVTCLIDKDEKHDLALVRLEAADRPAAILTAAQPLVGSRAYVIGAPKGFEFSIADGLVSQIQEIHGSTQYQLSCPFSGGNSGGPVVNDRGEVVGVAAWTQKDAQNLNFAIPASFVAKLNPNHAPTSWADSSRSGSASATVGAAKTAGPSNNLCKLKHTLKTSAGKHVTITVAGEEGEEKFDVVLPSSFVK